jgi:hypothetical protein
MAVGGLVKMKAGQERVGLQDEAAFLLQSFEGKISRK